MEVQQGLSLLGHIGTIIAAVIAGALYCQAWIFYARSWNDRWLNKILVAGLCALFPSLPPPPLRWGGGQDGCREQAAKVSMQTS